MNTFYIAAMVTLTGSILLSAIVNNASADTSVPASVTNLKNNSYNDKYINWIWIDPDGVNPRYMKVAVYLDGQFMAFVGSGVQHYNATKLNPNTRYTISVQTFDTRGSRTNKIRVNDSEWTAPNKDPAPIPSPDTTPPVISAITSSSITSSGATISWTTNEASDSQVEYGTTTIYGSSATLNTNLVTSHSQNISGLMANTTYHYRIRSRDPSGNLAISSDHAFTTPMSDICPDGVGWQIGWGTYKTGVWPGGCWRPLADNSPWNTPVPASPTVVPNSSTYVSSVMAAGSLNPDKNYVYANPGGGLDWSMPLFFSQSTDPWFRVHCSRPWGTCEVEGKVLQIPQKAHAAGGPTNTITYNSKGQPMCQDKDGHMAVIDQQTNFEYDFWQVCPRELPAGGTQGVPTDIYISWGGMVDISKMGDGTTPDGTPLVGTNGRAAHTPLSAGTIRVAELEAGEIKHALSIVIQYSNGKSVYPAGGGTGLYGGSQYPPMGQRFYLAMTPGQIDALQTSRTNKIIYKALAKYGGYVVDTGSGGFGVQIESDWSYTSFGYAGKIAENQTTKPYLTSWGTITLDHFPGSYLRAISPPPKP